MDKRFFSIVVLLALSVVLFCASCTTAQKDTTIENNFDELVKTYEPKDRDVWQKPDVIFNILGDMRGKTIADVGAGTGYFSIRLAPKSAKVLALEIDSRFVKYIDSVKMAVLEPEIAAKLETRLVGKLDPKLKPNEVDDILIVNTFGYIKDKVTYLERLQKGLKPGGRILIVDYRKASKVKKGFANYLVTYQAVEKMLEQAGFKRLLTDNYSLDYQYVIMGEKK